MTIELPRMKTAAGIDLDVSAERLKLEVDGMYELDQPLPFAVRAAGRPLSIEWQVPKSVDGDTRPRPATSPPRGLCTLPSHGSWHRSSVEGHITAYVIF